MRLYCCTEYQHDCEQLRHSAYGFIPVTKSQPCWCLVQHQDHQCDIAFIQQFYKQDINIEEVIFTTQYVQLLYIQDRELA